MEVAAAIGADLSIYEVDRTHRVSKKSTETTKANEERPRDIIVEFVSYISLQKLMKKKSLLKTNGYSAVFVNEDLTSIRNKILYQALMLQRQAHHQCLDNEWYYHY